MTSRCWMIGRMALIAIGACVALVSGAWGGLALWYRLPGGPLVRALGSAFWMLAVLALLVAASVLHSGLPLLPYVLVHALLLLWWMSIAPSNERSWADDVARPLTGSVEGQRVILDDVRNFNWRSDEDYDVRWETRRYDLERLRSADAVLSYWGSRAIAHAMISFGFDDGGHVVFSVEIRRRRGDRYTAIGGFFKQFETILVAADEHDIIRVRTNVRGEDDYLYPLQMDKPALRALFLSYVQAANRLADTPAFYHTITSNCTTLVYRMARQLDPGLPWDVRLLLTGYLPEYLYSTGALDRRRSIEQLRSSGRITERAKNSTAQDDFSHAIRAGMD